MFSILLAYKTQTLRFIRNACVQSTWIDFNPVVRNHSIHTTVLLVSWPVGAPAFLRIQSGPDVASPEGPIVDGDGNRVLHSEFPGPRHAESVAVEGRM